MKVSGAPRNAVITGYTTHYSTHCNPQLNSNESHMDSGIEHKFLFSNTMLYQSCIRGATSSHDHILKKAFVSTALRSIQGTMFMHPQYTHLINSQHEDSSTPTHTIMQLFTCNKRNICMQFLYSHHQSGWNQIISDNQKWSLLALAKGKVRIKCCVLAASILAALSVCECDMIS